jgi:hypothetical protein
MHNAAGRKLGSRPITGGCWLVQKVVFLAALPNGKRAAAAIVKKKHPHPKDGNDYIGPRL